MRRRYIFLLIFMVAPSVWSAKVVATDQPVYEVYAVRYARLLGYPVASLVKGADRERKLDLAMTFWVLKTAGRTVLVDAGFYRPKIMKRTDVADYTRPDKALERLAIKPDDVTDVIITHMHWDHADGVDLFPKAQIWIQRAEYEHSTEWAR